MSRNRELYMEIDVAGRTFTFEEIILQLNANGPEILDAYFAKAEIEKVYEGTQSTYTVQSGDTLGVVASTLGTTVEAIIESDPNITEANKNSLSIGQVIILSSQELKGEKITFSTLDKATIGDEVYIVVRTNRFEGKSLKINVNQGKEKGIEDVDVALTVQQDSKDVVLVEATVGDYSKSDYLNKDDYSDWAIAKIILKPLDNDKLKIWNDNLKKLKDEKTKLYLLVDAHSANTDLEIEYYGQNPKEDGSADTSTYKNFWLDLDSKWFELEISNCYCSRDLTEEEVKDIIIAMRKSETSVYQGENKEKLFWKSNCELSSDDKTFARFTEELNNVFNNYDINTCLRRMHFLAQVYHETDRFRTTKEYASTGSYAPYVGRGLMQLTWETNYEKYKSYSGEDCISDNEIIANDLENAFDSAGWFWKQGKELSVGTTWTPPSSAPNYVTSNNPSYDKTTITYTDDEGESHTYGTIDLNLIADDDYVDVISWLVNGGGNGLTERQEYLEELKDVFEYETKCKNNNE